MRFFVVVTLLFAPIALAQEADQPFDAGVVSAPPLISGDAPPQLLPTAVEVKKGPPAAPRWNRATGSLTGVLSGFRDYSAGIEFFGGVVFGTPQLTASDKQLSLEQTRARPLRDVSGWLVVPGLEVMWARLSGPVCAGSEFCGQRWVGGAGVRIGYADGIAREDGVVRLRRFFFGALSAQGAYVVVPPAPLTPASRWAEGVFRLRGGVQLNVASSRRAQLEGNGIILHLSGLVEYLAFSPVGGGVQFGAAFGLAF